ncbi:MAG: response regulator transcription factor [Limisphaerales bacterium]
MKPRARRPNRKPTARPSASAPKVQPIRLMLVDDHPVVREGLRSCLARLPQLTIVGEAASGEEALRHAARLQPDVVLRDSNRPGISGLVATARLRALVPTARVLILSVYENREYVAEVARSGARGYLLKDAAPEEM